MPLSTIFQLYHGGQFIGGGNQRTWGKKDLSKVSYFFFFRIINTKSIVGSYTIQQSWTFTNKIIAVLTMVCLFVLDFWPLYCLSLFDLWLLITQFWYLLVKVFKYTGLYL
jgi:hypothetical protein